MRLLLGIIFGAILTIGVVYLYDSHNAITAGSASAAAPRPVVNWDVVSTKWDHLTTRARAEIVRIAGR